MAKFDLKKAILENKATFFGSLTEGQFSWFTQDTDQQIGSEPENTLPFVYMHDNKGNKWLEKNYEGYGVFGGKDYYELLAEMNGVVERDKVELQGEAYTDYMRSKGIEIAFNGNGSGDHTDNVLYPNLVEMADGWRYDPMGPESCESQGFFYDDEDDGYGVFGGKDYYELLAEMNGVVERDKVELQGEAYTDYMRMKGIHLAFDNNGSGEHTDGVLYPNLVEMANGWQYDPIGPEGCEYQGFFYDDETDEDEDELGWNVADINEY